MLNIIVIDYGILLNLLFLIRRKSPIRLNCWKSVVEHPIQWIMSEARQSIFNKKWKSHLSRCLVDERGMKLSFRNAFKWQQCEYFDSCNGPTTRWRYAHNVQHLVESCKRDQQRMKNRQQTANSDEKAMTLSIPKKKIKVTHTHTHNTHDKFIEFFSLNLWTVIWVWDGLSNIRVECV